MWYFVKYTSIDIWFQMIVKLLLKPCYIQCLCSFATFHFVTIDCCSIWAKKMKSVVFSQADVIMEMRERKGTMWKQKGNVSLQVEFG